MTTKAKQSALERDKTHDPLPLLRLRGTNPLARGEQHGEELRPWVAAMAAIRLQLLRQECDFRSDQEIRELAQQHLPLLEDFAPDMLQECRGIARGADTPLADVIVINHYSDLRDLRRRRLSGVGAGRHGDAGSPQAIANAADPGGCSTVFVPRAAGALLGQTWDIHASAQDYVMLLHLREQVEGCAVESVLISVAGCVGMTGMSSLGLGVCINKLHSVRGQVGVMWSAIVRRVLRQRSVQRAMDVILSARIGGGRHYAAADARGVAAVEVGADGTARVPSGQGEPFCHTNHCVDAEMQRHHFIPPGSSTRRRLQTLQQRLAHAPPQTAPDMFDCLEQVVITPRPGVHNSATCAALVMDLAARRLHACGGLRPFSPRLVRLSTRSGPGFPGTAP